MTKAHATLSASIGSPAKKSPHVLKAALKGILSRPTRWHLRRVGKFPEPIKATAERSLHWATDINAWMDDPREWGAENTGGGLRESPSSRRMVGNLPVLRGERGGRVRGHLGRRRTELFCEDAMSFTCVDAGRRHAETVAASLHGQVASVKVLQLPDLAPKGDVTDFINACRDAEEAAERLATIANGGGSMGAAGCRRTDCGGPLHNHRDPARPDWRNR